MLTCKRANLRYLQKCLPTYKGVLYKTESRVYHKTNTNLFRVIVIFLVKINPDNRIMRKINPGIILHQTKYNALVKIQFCALNKILLPSKAYYKKIHPSCM